MRQLTVEYDNLSRPDGSALLAQGETVVQGAVYGPCEIRMSKELEDKACVEVIYYSNIGNSGVSDKAREQFICSTLESVVFSILYPRTSVTIILQEMTNDGSLLSACFNTAMLSLLDSGISLHCTVAAVTAVLMEDGTVHVDPNMQQEQVSCCQITYIFESIEQKVLGVYSNGACSHDDLQKCQVACKEQAKVVFDFYRDSVKRRYSKEGNTTD